MNVWHVQLKRNIEAAKGIQLIASIFGQRYAATTRDHSFEHNRTISDIFKSNQERNTRIGRNINCLWHLDFEIFSKPS
ncbi:MAG: hypothetical protein B7Z37_18195 [Verrucomicrobia bacterium 12-59-8]|nr:MAG: hypothetical protein B7Z37_18195 [Verrucomicrobia bacterium 12-59-8]